MGLFTMYRKLENSHYEIFCAITFQVDKFWDAPHLLYYILYEIFNV